MDPGDLADPAAALEALEATRFLVSMELRVSAVTDRADVVLPVAAAAEKSGTFVNWEGRPGTFGAALAVPEVRTDLQVLGALADEMDVHLGLPDAAGGPARAAHPGPRRHVRLPGHPVRHPAGQRRDHGRFRNADRDGRRAGPSGWQGGSGGYPPGSLSGVRGLSPG